MYVSKKCVEILKIVFQSRERFQRTWMRERERERERGKREIAKDKIYRCRDEWRKRRRDKISEIAAVETLFPIFRSNQTVYRLKVETNSYILRIPYVASYSGLVMCIKIFLKMKVNVSRRFQIGLEKFLKSDDSVLL